MNHWILSLPREDMKHCIKIGVFGLNRNYRLGQVLVGDKVICCASKEWSVIGFGEVTEPYYVDDTFIFKKSELFHNRIGFRADLLPKAREVNLRETVAELSIVKDPRNWGMHFRNGITWISDKDWELLQTRSRVTA